MGLYSDCFTPEKSRVVISRNGRTTTQKIVFFNKKGTFMHRMHCLSCAHKGRVQAGLGYHIEPTCDRDGVTWRRESGKTDKPCKFWKGRCQQ